MRIIVLINSFFFISFSYANETKFADSCLSGYYVKFNKIHNGYTVSQISDKYIDEENVLYAKFDERGKFDGLQIPKSQNGKDCIYLRSNIGNKAHCSGDFVISQLNKGDGTALPALTVMTAGVVPAFQFLSGSVSYYSNSNESNIELAKQAFDYNKYNKIRENIGICEKSFQENIKSVQQKNISESDYEQDFIKNIKVGTETNCGVVQYITGTNARLDIGDDFVWVKPNELLPKYNLYGEIIPCKLYKNAYGGYSFK